MFTVDQALSLERFPGALISETLIGQAWIRERGADYLGFAFNVAVGDGRDPGDHIAPALRAATIEASKRRVDLAAYRAGGVDLVEVKGRADLMALGQLQAYPILWRRTFPAIPVGKLELACVFIDADTLLLFNQAGIPVRLYPALVPSIRRT